MLLWKWLFGEVGELTTEPEVKQWVAERLGLVHRVKLASGDIEQHERVDWSVEWPLWERNLQALRWLSKNRRMPKSREGKAIRIPGVVQTAIDDALCGIRYALVGNDLAAGITPYLTCRDGCSAGHFHSRGAFDDLAVLWQAAFLSYFQPQLIEGVNICEECGKPISKTRKREGQSKGRFCGPKCRTTAWRRENPTKARELDREQKRQGRASSKVQSRGK